MKVHVLPASLADKIAAGEVVERPASVVKELVENSLDAGAKNITVEIKRGGITFIRVTDDGSGMHADDAKTAFLRHATSKISQVEDLSNILTYGFRGEALAAVCSVAKVELITCTDSASSAFYLSLEGGEIIQEDEIGAPLGTSIIVRDLFYNTPARLHFLKKDSTEAAAVATMLERIAVGRHDVSFTLISDQKVVFRTNKSDDMKNAIHSIFGSNISDHLLKVEFQYKNIEINGYVCKPCVMRSNRNLQFTYLNDRFIKSKIIYHGIDVAYSSAKETGKQPVCFLKYTIDPREVDVNVHPAKLEVKFVDESQVLVATKYGIMGALQSEVSFDIPSVSSDTASHESTQRERNMDAAIVHEPLLPNPIFGTKSMSGRKSDDELLEKYEEENAKSYNDTATLNHFGDQEIPRMTEYGYFIKPPSKTDNFEASFTNSMIPKAIKEKAKTPPSMFDATYDEYSSIGNLHTLPTDMKVLGEVFKVYILVEYHDTLYLVDKHAAHEKMIYNRLVKEATENSNVSAQILMSKIIITLSPEDLDVVLNNAMCFYKAGFDFHENGPDSIALTAVPSILAGESYTDVFVDILEMIRKHKSSITDRQDRMLKTIACRSAIKGGSACKIEEILPLISDLIHEKDVNYCPHGRPIVRSFTHKEIDKMFKRIK